MYHSFTAEELQSLAEELELEHPDYDRLAVYVNLVFYYVPTTETPEQAIRARLEAHIRDEEDYYVGDAEDGAEFAEEYFNNYVSVPEMPDWLVIDWEAVWDRNLCHDFLYDQGHYWFSH